MIPVLYDAKHQDFNNYGMGALIHTISCVCAEDENAGYTCELQYPIQGKLANKIKEDMIIKAKANDQTEWQLFRIIDIDKDTFDGIMIINAMHIWYDLMDNFIISVNAPNATCIQALNAGLSACADSHRFKGRNTDISHTGNYKLERVDGLQAIVGTRGSIIDTYGNGSTIIRDNFNIDIIQNRNVSKETTIAFRKNLTGFKEKTSLSNVVTKIYPYAKINVDSNGTSTEQIITLPEQFVVHENHSKYANKKIRGVDLSGDDVTTVEQLRNKANKYFNKSNTIPSVNYTISFIPLRKTTQYKNLSQLEQLGVGYRVTVQDERYGIDITTKVIKVKYDTLTEAYISMELGSAKASLTDVLGGGMESDNASYGDLLHLEGKLLEKATQMIKALSGDDGGYIRLRPMDNPNEILALDNENIDLAKNIYRLNREGFAKSANGINGPFSFIFDGTGDLSGTKILDNSIEAKKMTTKAIQDIREGLISTNDLEDLLDQYRPAHTQIYATLTQNINLIPIPLELVGKNIIVKYSISSWALTENTHVLSNITINLGNITQNNIELNLDMTSIDIVSRETHVNMGSVKVLLDIVENK